MTPMLIGDLFNDTRNQVSRMADNILNLSLSELPLLHIGLGLVAAVAVIFFLTRS